MEESSEQILSTLGDYIIEIEDFRIEETIGSGAFGEVYRAVHLQSGTECAVKKLFFDVLLGKNLKYFVREVQVLSKCHNVFLLPFLGFTNSAPFTIVTEYIPNGSLFNSLNDKQGAKKLTPTDKTIIAMGIAHGMLHLHKNNIIHRDLKSLNVLLDDNLYPKICDFGVSRIKSPENDLVTQHVGTTHCMAPECFETSNYTSSVDVYSYSILLYEMLTGSIPFRYMPVDQLVTNVFANGTRAKIPDDCPENLKSLIQAGWAQDPTRRPSFDEIYSSFKNKEVMFQGTEPSKIDDFIKFIEDSESNDFVNPLKRIQEMKHITLKQTKGYDILSPTAFSSALLLLRPDAPNLKKIPLRRKSMRPKDNCIEDDNELTEIYQELKGEPSKIEEFFFSKGYYSLPFNNAISMSIHILLASEMPEEAALSFDFADLCTHVAKYPKQILRIYSVIATKYRSIKDKTVFDPFLNEGARFLSYNYGIPYFRIIFDLLRHKKFKATRLDICQKIFIIGLYSMDLETVSGAASCLYNLPDCEIPADVLIYHLNDEKANDIIPLILKQKTNPIYVEPLLNKVKKSEFARLALCKLAEELPDEFFKKTEWMSCIEALPIILILYENRSKRQLLYESYSFYCHLVLILPNEIEIVLCILNEMPINSKMLVLMSQAKLITSLICKFQDITEVPQLINGFNIMSKMSKVAFSRDYLQLIRELPNYVPIPELAESVVDLINIFVIRPQTRDTFKDFHIDDLVSQINTDDPVLKDKINHFINILTAPPPNVIQIPKENLLT